MASEIEGCELHVADGELLGGCVALEWEGQSGSGELTRVQGCIMVSRHSTSRRGGERTGLQDRYTVVLQHVQKRCLSGIVKTEEEQLCVLVGKAEGGKKVED